MVTCLTHGDSIGWGEGGKLDSGTGGEGVSRAKCLETSGSEGYLIFTIWLIVAFDFRIQIQIVNWNSVFQ